ncbi:uncharacterized protein LOC141655253 [Silene latifolia]|uniref:uncharacterized protein LOC141655253 n=1 Tax=Silene latifolia TaxID=37657 RepID=UPI003D78ABC6
MCTLETFSHWSGLSANNDKTDVYFGGVPATVKHQILQVTGFSEGRFPFRYLGLPLHTARNTFDNYRGLITKIKPRLNIGQPSPSLMLEKFTYNLIHNTIWDNNSKPYHSESFRSILAVKEEILGRTGTIHAASVLLNSWVQNGKFHIKAAYDWFRTPATALPWAPALNSQFLIPSHRLITTLALQEKLATVDKIAARGFSIANRFILCKEAQETHSHIFLQCSFSRHLWTGILTWLGLPHRAFDLTKELLWCIEKKHIRHWKNGWFISLYRSRAVYYHIWAERNARIFLGAEKTATQLLYIIRNNVSSRILGKVPSKDYEKAVHRLNFF